MATKLKTLKPRLTSPNTGRLQELTGGWRTKGMGSTARGYGYRWQKARELHLQKQPLCVMCDQEGKVTVATVVDHRTPHRGDQALFWDESNWDSLCKPHHDAKTRAGE